MSLSSGSSLCGNDQDLFVDDEEDIDFYAILNVSREATDDDITKAYRKRCLIFHPDRHTDEDDKKEAEKIFVQLRRAHETLMDPKQRAIYDSLGVQGLDTQGWELVSRSANPENIKREFEFLQRLKDQELMMQRLHPQSSFSVKTSIAGLFYDEPEDRFAPYLVSIGMSQSVDSALTSSDRVGLTGRAKMANGRGDGAVALIWKRAAGSYNLESNLQASPDAVGLTCRVSRNVFTRAAIIVQPQIQYSLVQEAVIPAVTFIYSMRLRVRWHGSLVFSWSPVQSGLTTTLVHLENNQPKVIANFTLSPTNSNMRVTYNIRDSDKDAVTETSCQISMFGISPTIHMERRLSRFSRMGVALSFSFPSCMLYAKFKLKTGHSSYEWQVVLCDDKECVARSALYGIALPYATFMVARIVFRPLFEKVSSIFDDHSKDKEVDVAKQEESTRVITLMRPTAERIKREEETKQGIVIVMAKYGQTEMESSRAYPLLGDRTIDVTIPLQAMVNDSQLRIYSVKSQLPGFYDPCPGDQKMLHVKYTFRGEMHAVTVADEMPMQIPLRAHRLTDNSPRRPSNLTRMTS